MNKKLSFYLNNANFKETVKKSKNPVEIRTAQKKDKDLLKIVNGEICLDDNEMYVNLNREEDMEVVEDTDLVTSATYATKKRQSTRWSKEETEYFYEALSLCGLDFTLISELFDSKDRRSCRLKYKNEYNKNTDLILSLMNKKESFCPKKYKILRDKINKQKF